MQLFFNFIALCSLCSYFCHPCKVCYALKSKPNSAVMNCAPYVPFSSHHGVKRYSSPFREEVLYVVIYKYGAQLPGPPAIHISGPSLQQRQHHDSPCGEKGQDTWQVCPFHGLPCLRC